MNLAFITTAIILGGLIKGLNGFGYALVSTSLLTLFMPAQEAVALMIIPLIIANIELTTKLSMEELKACLTRFRAYIAASFIGVTLGMILIEYMPALLLKKAVGLLVLVFVASRTRKISKIFTTAKEFCVENQRVEPLLGLLSGLIFGSSNGGVPFVAYFKELQLSREKFVSMIAITVLGASLLRIGLAASLGLYTGMDAVLISAALGVPGLIAVKTGDKLGEKLSEKITEKASLLLLLAIGLRLVL